MKYFYKLFCFIFFITITPLFSQEEIEEELLEQIRKMSLEEILNSEISVASQTPMSMREAPGIVTLITREDILNSGARDLIDVLTLLVPGFHFMSSEFGPIGAGIRGIWAYEGKLLLLIDGIDCNDEGFSGVIFGNHYLLENIERIEVIRGPGTVIYGGSAGLGVINIITRNYNVLQGGYAGVQYSRMYNDFTHENFSFGIGKKLKDVGLSLTGYSGRGRLSDKEYIPYFEDQTRSSSNVIQDPVNLNLNVNYSGLDVRGILDFYHIRYDIPIDFKGYYLQIKYDYNVNDKIKLTVKINEKYQNPWNFSGKGFQNIDGERIDTFYNNDKVIEKRSGSLMFNWNLFYNTHLLAGIETYNTELSTYPKPGYYEIPVVKYEHIIFNNYVGYFQLMYQPYIMNIIIGGRLEHSTLYGTYFVPRIALTRTFDKFHTKFMISQAYRNPSGRYFDENIKPEKSMNYEIEAGYQFLNSHYLVANFFDIGYKDVITHKVDSLTGNLYYDNSERIGSRGFEIEYKLMKPNFNLGVNFSYYTMKENSIDLYKPFKDKDEVLGYPHVKINAFTGIKISEKLSINPSVSFFGSRYGYISGRVFVENNVPRAEHNLKNFSPTILLNINFRTNDLFINGLQADLGIKNLLNADYEYIQAFQGYLAPLPAPSTAIVFRLHYEFHF